MSHPGAADGGGRADLSVFLLREGMDGMAVERLLSRLEPFFAIADRGEYRLTGTPVDVNAVAHAIAIATASPARTIRAASAASLRSMPTHGGRARVLGSLGANIRHGVWIDIVKRDVDALRAALGDDRKTALWSAYAGSHVWRLRPAFDAAFTRILGYDLALHAWNTVEETAFSHLGLSLAGEPDRAARLEPLLAVLPAAIPLCRARDDAGAWLVLTG